MQLQPQEYFAIVRQIEDPLDIATSYYPQAEIRNARTDELLATVDLESKGDGRYSKRWQVPADVSGLGFYLTIITKVYTDSDHTTESPNYGRKEQTILVQERNVKLGGGGGISYKDVKDAIAKVLEEKGIKEVKFEAQDLSSIIEAVKAIPADVTARVVDAMPEQQEVPEIKETDLQPVIKAITESQKSIIAAIDAKEIPEYDQAFSNMTELFRSLDNRLTKADIDGALGLLPELNAELKKLADPLSVIEELQKGLKDNYRVLSGFYASNQPQESIRGKLPGRLRGALRT